MKTGGRKVVRLAVVQNGRELGKDEGRAVLIEVSRGMRERQEWEQQLRALSRRPARQESMPIRAAMQSVEQRIVRGLWVLEISQAADGPSAQRKHGIGYLPEEIDHYGTVASGGKWEAPPPRPAIPSSKEIDAAVEAKGWIEWLDEDQAKLLTVAAMTKRGDRERRIHWDRVFSRLPHLAASPLRTLRDRYDHALRNIVAELTLRSVAK